MSEGIQAYLQFLEAVIPHKGVARAFAEAAVRHRRMEQAFNERLLGSCPSPELLRFPHMELEPPVYWQRNFFSILFLSIFEAIGIAEKRQHGYGMMLHAVRGLVTATDNILDAEAKGSVLVQLRGGKVLPNVLVLLLESGLLHGVLSEFCVDAEATRRTWTGLMQALFALGDEESAEESAIEEVLDPKRLLDQVHRFRGGGLLLLAFVAPELNEPLLAKQVRVARAGVNHIGLALQILDDITDLEEDLRNRNHNLLRSWVVTFQPDGPCTDAALSALPADVLMAPERAFPCATRQVMRLAIEMALRGFDLLHQAGHPADREGALVLIEAMFKLRGLERLWSMYEHGASPEAGTPDYAPYFPAV